MASHAKRTCSHRSRVGHSQDFPADRLGAGHTGRACGARDGHSEQLGTAGGRVRVWAQGTQEITISTACSCKDSQGKDNGEADVQHVGKLCTEQNYRGSEKRLRES